MTVIGALDDRVGLRHYEVINQCTTADTFTVFLSNLIEKLHNQPATLVLDNLGVHHSKKVAALLKNHP